MIVEKVLSRNYEEELEESGYILIDDLAEWERMYRENPEDMIEEEEIFDFLLLPFDI